MSCAVCNRRLTAADVSRAIHSPRPARAAGDVHVRFDGAAGVERRSTTPATPTKRDAAGKAQIQWPPTPASRASAEARIIAEKKASERRDAGRL